VYDVARRADAEAVISRMFTYLVLVLTFLALALTFFCKPLLRILTTPTFLPAATLVPLIVLAYFLRSLGEFFRIRFLVAGKPQYEAVSIAFSTAICAVGYYILIPRFGAWGAAVATVITFAFLIVFSVISTFILEPYQVEGRLFKVVLTGLLLLGLFYAVPVQSLPTEIVWGVALLLGYPALLWASGFARQGEIAIAGNMLGRIARRGSPSVLVKD
jgi:O-antigen/teichoic acid export membrane protein